MAFVRLIWRESRFNPSAVSPKGAQGIAQFMPGTAIDRGLDNPFEPKSAIMHSASLLADLLREFGNFGLAAAAYNAGEERVRGWLAGNSGLPWETEAYVQFVTGRAAAEWKLAETDLPTSLKAKGQEVQIASPALSDELLLSNQEIRTGLARADALRRFARRSGVEDVYSLTAMLIQADKLGTSIAQSLRAHAESMRTKRRQRAEQAARKAGIKLAFPLVFMIFPALLIVILGPAVIQLMQAIAAQNASH